MIFEVLKVFECSLKEGTKQISQRCGDVLSWGHVLLSDSNRRLWISMRGNVRVVGEGTRGQAPLKASSFFSASNVVPCQSSQRHPP